MSIHVHNLSIGIVNHDYKPGWTVYTTAGELHLDGSTLHNAKTLIVTAALNDAQVSSIFHLYTLHVNFNMTSL